LTTEEELCELGLVYSTCIDTKGEDTIRIRKAKYIVTEKNGDKIKVCDGCISNYREDYDLVEDNDFIVEEL